LEYLCFLENGRGVGKSFAISLEEPTTHFYSASWGKNVGHKSTKNLESDTKRLRLNQNVQFRSDFLTVMAAPGNHRKENATRTK
jgi:hypothetical protein